MLALGRNRAQFLTANRNIRAGGRNPRGLCSNSAQAGQVGGAAELLDAADRLAAALSDEDEEEIVAEFKKARRSGKAAAR